MNKCYSCGAVFEDYEIECLRGFLGECHGVPVFEQEGVCPCCGGDFDDAHMCEGCEEYFLSDELNDGLCESCYAEREEQEGGDDDENSEKR